jgi:hypothetical protein
MRYTQNSFEPLTKGHPLNVPQIKKHPTEMGLDMTVQAPAKFRVLMIHGESDILHNILSILALN